MTSIHDGKETDNSVTATPKLKNHYIQLYKSLDARLTSESDLRTRVSGLCEAWRNIYELCLHSTGVTQPLLVSWIEKQTATTLLRTEWQSPKNADVRAQFDEVLNVIINQIDSSISSRDAATSARYATLCCREEAISNRLPTASSKDATQSTSDPVIDWEKELLQMSRHYKSILADPWGHPVLRLLLDPKGEQPDERLLKEWISAERSELIVCRLRQLCASKCNDLALSLASAVMSRTRNGVPCDDQLLSEDSNESSNQDTEFATFLKTEAGFNTDFWDLMTDIELVLLHRMERIDQCIELAKQIPLRFGYQIVERLRTRLERTPKEKKIWKNAKDVAILVVQLIIARCMVVRTCNHVCRSALYWCARALARLAPPDSLRSACTQLAAPAATARHLHTLATAVRAQCENELRPLVCELFIRAITAGGNELERLKSKTEKESEAREMEKTICTWFVQLSSLLSDNVRIVNECLLTAFSVHPSVEMYKRLEQAPRMAITETESKKHSPSDFSWSSDSRSTKSAFVKTSETLNLSIKTQEAATLSTAILSEGEKVGLSPELCQDLAVLLGGPRIKTFSWDMGREELLNKCRGHVERTGGGTRAIRTELRYLNLEPAQLKHLKEEVDDDEDDVYYGIEKGYEYLLEIPEEIVHFDTDKVSIDWSSDSEVAYPTKGSTSRRKKVSSEDEDSDPLSLVAESKRNAYKERKERPHSKERYKDNSTKKEHNASKSGRKPRSLSREKSKDGTKKEKKHKHKKDVKDYTDSNQELSKLIGVKVSNTIPEQYIKKVRKKKERRKESMQSICPPITDSDYDSQGKSSLTSSQGTADEQSNVQFDGLFSMDDFKTVSPEKIIEQYTQEIKPNIGNQELNISKGSVHLSFNKPTTPITYNITHSETPLRPIGETYQSAKPSTSVKDKAKNNITRLLEFRRQKPHLLQSTKVLDPYKLYNTSTNANSATSTNRTQKDTSSLSMDYINKYYPQIQLKTVNSANAPNTKKSPVIIYPKHRNINEKSPNAEVKTYNTIQRPLIEKETVHNLTYKLQNLQSLTNISSNVRDTSQGAKINIMQRKGENATYSKLNFLHKNKNVEICKPKTVDTNKTHLHYEPDDLDVELAKFVKLNSDINLDTIKSENILNVKVQNMDKMVEPSIIPKFDRLLKSETKNNIAIHNRSTLSDSTLENTKSLLKTKSSILDLNQDQLSVKYQGQFVNKRKVVTKTPQTLSESIQFNTRKPDSKSRQDLCQPSNSLATSCQMKMSQITTSDLKSVKPENLTVRDNSKPERKIISTEPSALIMSKNQYLKPIKNTYTSAKESDKQSWTHVMDRILSCRTPKRVENSEERIKKASLQKNTTTDVTKTEKPKRVYNKKTDSVIKKPVIQVTNIDLNKDMNVNKEVLKKFIESSQINPAELPELDCDILDDLLDNDLLQEISELTSDDETYQSDSRVNNLVRKNNTDIKVQPISIPNSSACPKIYSQNTRQPGVLKVGNVQYNQNTKTENIPCVNETPMKTVVYSNDSLAQQNAVYSTGTNSTNVKVNTYNVQQPTLNNNLSSANSLNDVNTQQKITENATNIIIPNVNIVRHQPDTVLVLRTNNYAVPISQPNIALIQSQYVALRPQIVYQPSQYITFNNVSVANSAYNSCQPSAENSHQENYYMNVINPTVAPGLSKNNLGSTNKDAMQGSTSQATNYTQNKTNKTQSNNVAGKQVDSGQMQQTSKCTKNTTNISKIDTLTDITFKSVSKTSSRIGNKTDINNVGLELSTDAENMVPLKKNDIETTSLSKLLAANDALVIKTPGSLINTTKNEIYQNFNEISSQPPSNTLPMSYKGEQNKSQNSFNKTLEKKSYTNANATLSQNSRKSNSVEINSAQISIMQSVGPINKQSLNVLQQKASDQTTKECPAAVQSELNSIVRKISSEVLVVKSKIAAANDEYLNTSFNSPSKQSNEIEKSNIQSVALNKIATSKSFNKTTTAGIVVASQLNIPNDPKISLHQPINKKTVITKNDHNKNKFVINSSLQDVKLPTHKKEIAREFIMKTNKYSILKDDSDKIVPKSVANPVRAHGIKSDRCEKINNSISSCKTTLNCNSTVRFHPSILSRKKKQDIVTTEDKINNVTENPINMHNDQHCNNNNNNKYLIALLNKNKKTTSMTAVQTFPFDAQENSTIFAQTSTPKINNTASSPESKCFESTPNQKNKEEPINRSRESIITSNLVTKICSSSEKLFFEPTSDEKDEKRQINKTFTNEFEIHTKEKFIPKISNNILTDSFNRNKDSNKDYVDRLTKKRLAILNRVVTQTTIYPPIPLTYVPLEGINSTMDIKSDYLHTTLKEKNSEESNIAINDENVTLKLNPKGSLESKVVSKPNEKHDNVTKKRELPLNKTERNISENSRKIKKKLSVPLKRNSQRLSDKKKALSNVHHIFNSNKTGFVDFEEEHLAKLSLLNEKVAEKRNLNQHASSLSQESSMHEERGNIHKLKAETSSNRCNNLLNEKGKLEGSLSNVIADEVTSHKDSLHEERSIFDKLKTSSKENIKIFDEQENLNGSLSNIIVEKANDNRNKEIETNKEKIKLPTVSNIDKTGCLYNNSPSIDRHKIIINSTTETNIRPHNMSQESSVDNVNINNKAHVKAIDPKASLNKSSTKDTIKTLTNEKESIHQKQQKHSDKTMNIDKITLGNNCTESSTETSVKITPKTIQDFNSDRTLNKKSSINKIEHKATTNNVDKKIHRSSLTDDSNSTSVKTKDDVIIIDDDMDNKIVHGNNIIVKILNSNQNVKSTTLKYQQKINITLPNGKSYAATVTIDKMISTRELMESANFKNILSKLVKEAEATKLEKGKVKNLTASSTFIPQKPNKSTLTKNNDNIETINLLSDEDDEDLPSFYEFNTEYGTYKISRNIDHDLFLKHQKVFLMKSKIIITRCNNKLNNCKEEVEKSTECIPINTTSMPITISQNEELSQLTTLRRNFFRELVPLLTQKNVVDTVVLSDTDSDDCQNTKLENLCLNKCFVKLVKCDNLLRTNEKEAKRSVSTNHVINHNFINHDTFEYPKNTVARYGRTSPVIDIYNMLASLEASKIHRKKLTDFKINCGAEWLQNKQSNREVYTLVSFESSQLNRGNLTKEPIKCDAEWFQNKQYISRNCRNKQNNITNLNYVDEKNVQRNINNEETIPTHSSTVIKLKECESILSISPVSSIETTMPTLASLSLKCINNNWRTNPLSKSRFALSTYNTMPTLTSKILNIINSQWGHIEHYELLLKNMRFNTSKNSVNKLKRKCDPGDENNIMRKHRKYGSVKFKSKNVTPTPIEILKNEKYEDLPMCCIYYYDYDMYFKKCNLMKSNIENFTKSISPTVINCEVDKLNYSCTERNKSLKTSEIVECNLSVENSIVNRGLLAYEIKSSTKLSDTECDDTERDDNSNDSKMYNNFIHISTISDPQTAIKTNFVEETCHDVVNDECLSPSLLGTESPLYDYLNNQNDNSEKELSRVNEMEVGSEKYDQVNKEVTDPGILKQIFIKISENKTKSLDPGINCECLEYDNLKNDKSILNSHSKSETAISSEISDCQSELSEKLLINTGFIVSQSNNVPLLEYETRECDEGSDVLVNMDNYETLKTISGVQENNLDQLLDRKNSLIINRDERLQSYFKDSKNVLTDSCQSSEFLIADTPKCSNNKTHIEVEKNVSIVLSNCEPEPCQEKLDSAGFPNNENNDALSKSETKHNADTDTRYHEDISFKLSDAKEDVIRTSSLLNTDIIKNYKKECSAEFNKLDCSFKFQSASESQEEYVDSLKMNSVSCNEEVICTETVSSVLNDFVDLTKECDPLENNKIKSCDEQETSKKCVVSCFTKNIKLTTTVCIEPLHNPESEESHIAEVLIDPSPNMIQVQDSLNIYDASKNQIYDTIFSNEATRVDEHKFSYSDNSSELGSPEKMDFIMPHATYSFGTVKRVKRKLDMKDVVITTKKFRKCKNIDVFKQSITDCIKNTSIKNEFKKTIDYCKSVKFSFSIQYHDDYFEPESVLRNWPIKIENIELNSDRSHCNDDSVIPLIYNDDINTAKFTTVKQQTLLEEINDGLIDENNFDVGFGERSGRVIQNITDSQLLFSAATLSDVKHIQPCIYTDDSKKYITMDQAEKMRQHFYFINLRAKVKSFFEKSALELHNFYVTNTNEKKKMYRNMIQTLPGLCDSKYIIPNSINQIVQVVQVGQPPVSASAQNPVTCDSIGNQGTENSPTQCVGQSPLNEDTPTPIGTSSEYTELTSANLNVPSARDLIEAHRQNEESMTTEQIIEGHLCHSHKSNFHTVIKEIDTHAHTHYSENSDDILQQNGRYDYSNNMHNQYNNNSETSLISEQLMFGSGDQDSMDGPPLRQDNSSSEKSDQIAHAMSAAGIVTSDVEENTLDAISQELESQGLRSTDRMPPITIQQALAQLLPSSINQSISENSHDSQSGQISPQILRFVQNQQSVISSPNGTQVLHIVQNKNTNNGSVNNGENSNTFNGISLIDAGGQNRNQLLQIVNTAAVQKGQNSGQLIKRLNLVTNIANAQGSHEQKVVQFVCKSQDGKSLQVNTGHQRSMVLRLQPIESPTIHNIPCDNVKQSPNNNITPTQEEVNKQDSQSQSGYEEKFAPNASGEKSTSLPKFNQAFGKPVFEDKEKQGDSHSNSSELQTSGTPNGQSENNIDKYEQHINNIKSTMLRKSSRENAHSQGGGQQLKQNAPPVNIQTMHGGVIYTRQIPVNIGGQTVNLITVPSTEMVDENQTNNHNKEAEPSIIKIVPQTPAPNAEVTPEENNPHMITNEKIQSTRPVLTQMRIKLPMLSKGQHVVHGGRVVRPSFLQIQRNVIGGTNQPVYRQLVLTAAPGQTVRLPQTSAARTVRVNSGENRSAEMSSSTLEQLREFDMVLEQVKERSTVQPEGGESGSSAAKRPTAAATISVATPTAPAPAPAATTVARNATPQQVFYSIAGNQTFNLAYINRKAPTAAVAGAPAASAFLRCANGNSVLVASKSKPPRLPDPPNLPRSKTKPRVRPKITHQLPAALKMATMAPKPVTQKPLEDEQTTRRILYILAEYREQVENSPDKNKPAPRRRNATPGPPMKRRRDGSGEDSPGSPAPASPTAEGGAALTPPTTTATSPTAAPAPAPARSTISPSRIAELQAELASPHNCPRKVSRKMHYDPELNSVVTTPRVSSGLRAALERNRANNANRAAALFVPAGCILPVSVMRGARLLVAPRPRLVLRPEEPARDGFNPDAEINMDTSKLFDKIFEADPKVGPNPGLASEQASGSQEQQDGKKDGGQNYHRLLSSRHKYTILEQDLQKSLTDECADLGMDSPSAADLFPESDLFFSSSPHSQAQQPNQHSAPTPSQNQPQRVSEDDINEQLIVEGHPNEVAGDVESLDSNVGVVTVTQDGYRTIVPAVDHEEFARAHPNTTFHSEEDVDNSDVYTIRDVRGKHVTSTVFHSVISQAHAMRYTDIDNIIDSIPGPGPASRAESDPGAGTGIESGPAPRAHSAPASKSGPAPRAHSAPASESGPAPRIHPAPASESGPAPRTHSAPASESGPAPRTHSAPASESGAASRAEFGPATNVTHVIRRVYYEDDKRYLMDETDIIAGNDARMGVTGDMEDSNGRNPEIFWESNDDSRCRSPFLDDTTTDSMTLASHMRLDSVIKEAKSSTVEETSQPTLRTYPAKRTYHNLEDENIDKIEKKSRDSQKKTDRSVKKGCHCSVKLKKGKNHHKKNCPEGQASSQS